MKISPLRSVLYLFLLNSLCLCLPASSVQAAEEKPALEPIVRVVDLDVGESTTVTLSNSEQVKVKLLDLKETRDPIRQAVRSAIVTVEVDGEQIQLESGMYNLPQTIGKVQIDCSITGGYNSNGTPAFWGLDKDARLRFWPADSPLIKPGSFIYPVDQRWFATRTWYDNEPVDGGTKILPKIYYHSGLDIGGAEKLTRVIAATDAIVVSSGNDVLDAHKKDTPVSPRYDVVYLLDARGWYYRYSHLHKINERIRPGRLIKQGDEIGILGKKGASGGWSHLHLKSRVASPPVNGARKRAMPSSGKHIVINTIPNSSPIVVANISSRPAIPQSSKERNPIVPTTASRVMSGPSPMAPPPQDQK